MGSSLKWRATELVVAESAFVLVVTTVAVIGNLMIFCALCRNSRLRTESYASYIASFSAADLLTSLVVAPLSAASIVKGQWIFSEAVCQFQGFVCSFMVEVIVLTLTLAAADRCFALARPLKYSRKIASKIAAASVITAWVLALIPPGAFLLNDHKFVFHPGSTFCRPDMKNIDYRFAVAAEIVFIVLPLLVVAGCYIEIKCRTDVNLKKLAKAKEPNKERFTVWDREESSTRLIGLLTATVLLCWLPFLLVNIIEDFTMPYFIPRSIHFVSSLLALLSCALKIFIYCVMSEEIRAEFGKIVKSKRSGRVIALEQSHSAETSETSTSNRRMEKYIRPKTATAATSGTIENKLNKFEELISFEGQAEAASETSASASRQIVIVPYGKEGHFKKYEENKSVPLESSGITLDQGFSLHSYSDEKQIENNPPLMNLAAELTPLGVQPGYARKKILPPIVQHRVSKRIFNKLAPVTSGNKIDESFV